MPDEILRVEHLVKHFPIDGKRYIGAVNDVCFVLRRGETLGLVGESGSGKSTIGRCILGLELPTAGSVTFNDEPLIDERGNFNHRMRSRLQLVFQDPAASLNPRRTLHQAISEPLRLSGERSEATIRTRVREIVEAVGLEPSLLGEHPVSLSPSEQQRTGIARALITRPEIVVLDEPTSLLDPTVRADIIDVLQAFQRRHATSYLFISHDMEAVRRLSHRIAVLYLGRLLEEAETSAIMQSQSHPYSRALLRSVLPPDPTVTLHPAPIGGEIPTAINPVDCCPFNPRCGQRETACDGPFPAYAPAPGAGRVACHMSGIRTEGFPG